MVLHPFNTKNPLLARVILCDSTHNVSIQERIKCVNCGRRGNGFNPHADEKRPTSALHGGDESDWLLNHSN